MTCLMAGVGYYRITYLSTVLAMNKGVLTYENRLVGLMALIFGCLFFDRLSLNFLMPFVAKDLALTDTQIGLLAGALSLAWALSGYFITAWAEKKTGRKPFLWLPSLPFRFARWGQAGPFRLLRCWLPASSWVYRKVP